MKIVIQESDLLRDLAFELVCRNDLDYPQHTSSTLATSVEFQLRQLLGYAMAELNAHELELDMFKMVSRIRRDELLVQLLQLPWKTLNLVDIQGTIVLTF